MEEQKETTRKYSNEEITVIWNPDMCMHFKFCWTGLPEVFDPNSRPWVNIGGASTEQIVRQVENCPSGALSYFYNSSKK